ncbi:hypothetical protein XELAEV_18038974mg [Xenopus laevis]|uniref:Uncharacterized protein n=1 Tax=Xenopus laevis TaxID=8355 RepID=A0A974C6Y5_XENLA|nr:hypothetical protein XELAEV_18038974mg [Xenopus laevis]
MHKVRSRVKEKFATLSGAKQPRIFNICHRQPVNSGLCCILHIQIRFQYRSDTLAVSYQHRQESILEKSVGLCTSE